MLTRSAKSPPFAKNRVPPTMASSSHRTLKPKKLSVAKPLLASRLIISCSKGDQHAGTRGADRMTEDDGAVHVHLLRIPSHVLAYGEGLGGKGFIGLHSHPAYKPQVNGDGAERGEDRVGAAS